MKLAILDDYQNVALSSADWSAIASGCDITVFNHVIGDERAVIAALNRYDIICCMRERTAFPAEVLQQLPQLKLLVTTGVKNAAIDFSAAEQCGVLVCGTQSPGHAAAELAWGLIMSLAKNIHLDNKSIREGHWQTRLGTDLKYQTLGILGLGRHGQNVARFAHAFGMRCIAWSQNLTPQQCTDCHVEWVDKDTLFSTSDFITIHLKMGTRNRALVGADEFSCMKSSAYLINTSRGAIVNESAMLKALEHNAIAGVGLDVYEQEPMLPTHPLLALDNALLTPHTGYVTRQTYTVFYEQTVDIVNGWLKAY